MVGSEWKTTGAFHSYKDLTSTTYGGTTAPSLHIDYDAKYFSSIYKNISKVDVRSYQLLMIIKS